MSQSDLPWFVDRTGTRRVLAALPSPEDHPLRSSPTWTQAGLPLLSYKEIGNFKHVWSQVAIEDQASTGSCLPHAWVEALMLARLASGAPPVRLSPYFLYTLIDGGVDGGASPGDAVTALVKYGACRWELVPEFTVRPPGYSAAAAQDALRFRLLRSVRVTTPLEAANAIFMRWPVCFDIRADGLEADVNGVANFIRGGNDHEVLAAERFCLHPQYGPLFGGRNSWGPSFGQAGFCWWREDHLGYSGETHAVQAAYDDPQDLARLVPA